MTQNSDLIQHGGLIQRSGLTHHSGFVTTSRAGLNWNHPALKLFQKSKKHGIWNPQAIDLSKDAQDYAKLSDLEQTVLQHLTSLFAAGEESVTLDLLPLMLAVAREGRIEEEMYLTSFLWEEAKHTEFFSRVLHDVFRVKTDLHSYHSDAYKQLFYQALPEAMNALLTDTSAKAQAVASVTYNMVVEGVLAETGYHAYYTMLERNNLLPGLREGIGLLKLDESRHIAYGVFLLSRLVAEDNSLWDTIEARLGELLELALGVIADIFGRYETMPFGLDMDDFISYAASQFSKRSERIERAKSQTLAEILGEDVEMVA
jgi:ribonucleoside-diphosphate reductase beta chain